MASGNKKKLTRKKKVPKASATKEKAAPDALEKGKEFPIVGIGASAGGLEALEIFFTNMPAQSNTAFVIIQHLSPTHKSIMSSLLSKYTQMIIFDIKDNMQIKPNCVYLNPPNKNVTIFNGTIQLMDPIVSNGINLPIDCFFRSMAEELGEKAICIILSGTATDGTLGIKAVKGEGGIAMVQDPHSAKYDGMPRSAIATGLIDYILPVEKIPQALINYMQTPYIEGPKKIRITDNQFATHIKKVFFLIRAAMGHDFSHYKQNTICRRIERRMAVHQINTIADYVLYLQKNSTEVDTLFKDLLIGVTNFFRDTEAFDVLKHKVIPEFLKTKSPDTPIRIWAVGCSTGEEAYSMAIVFNEVMESQKRHFTIQIFATDIDAQSIDFARTGIYPDSIAADISQDRLDKFFIKEENTYKIKKQIREMVIYAIHNIIKDPPFSKIDLISCRNLLIYMDSELQKKILPLTHYTLNQGGILFLGTSESIGDFVELFAPIDAKWKIFRRKDCPMERVFEYATTPFYYPSARNEGEEKKAAMEVDIPNVAERIILQEYAQPGVIINEQYEIVHFMGKTAKFLEPPSGRATFNIIKMAREDLRFKLSNALHNAVKQKKTLFSPGIRVKYNKEFHLVNVTVRPLMESSHVLGFYLVLFDDRTPSDTPVHDKGKKRVGPESDPVIVRLERELECTKEHLQTTIEEMETSNEELKSTNEELQSVNEELQSTNEELETSKEELQSTNEELVTVNTELQKKVDELSEVNNDINNLLASTNIGTIFLDTTFCIKRFTPAMTKIFNLMPIDIGRSISDITSKIAYKDLFKDAKDVLETLIQSEKEVHDMSGSWYAVRIAPYRTIENVIDGIVITFVDITSLKKGEEKLQIQIDKSKKLEEEVRESERKWRSLVENSPDHIMLLDLEGKILFINHPPPGRTIDEMIGRSQFACMPKKWHHVAKECFNEVIKSGKLGSYTTNYHGKEGNVSYFHIRVGPVLQDGKVVACITYSTDITDQKKMEESLRKSEARMRLLLENSPDFIMVVDQSGTIHYINRILADLTIEEMIGKPLYNFQPPESRDKYKALLAQVFQGGKIQTIEVPVTGPDEIITWYETGIVPIKDNEKVVSAMLFTKDITGRKEAQKEFDNTITHLKKQLQRFKSND